ncbi:MAG: LptA/OstA family protein [Oligoflexales bacterium]|nr:LptA/OstA family protein [Oligoflexales bacterium]
MVFYIKSRGKINIASLFLAVASEIFCSSGCLADLLDEDPSVPSVAPVPPKILKVKEANEPLKKPVPHPQGQRAADKEPSPLTKQGNKVRTKTSESFRADEKNSDEQKKLPVHFRGDGLVGSRRDGYLELQKDVLVSQGDLTLKSDYAQVYYEDSSHEVKKIIAKGHVKVQRPAAGDRALLSAKSDEIEFDVAKQRLVLQGHAELAKDGDLVKGERINYDIKTGWIDASQVKGVLRP